MSSGGPQSAVHILLVEDNPADARLLTALLKNSQIPFNIEVVTDGEEATRYLTQADPHSTVQVPDIVLLDINLPKKDGFEVLAEIRQDARVAGIPVIIISSSKNPEDVRRGQALNASGFFAKPSDIGDYERLAETLIQEEFPRAMPVRFAAFSKKSSQTPLAAAESKGRQSDDLFRQIVEAVKDYAIFMLDARGNILTWNAGAERVKGYKASEIIGRHFSVFYPEADLKRHHPAHELEVATKTGRFEEEGWRVRKDGSTFWAHVTITAIRDAVGKLIGFGKVTRDFTERRESETKLRESERRFRLLVEGVKDYAIFMLSPEGLIASWNVGAERINGYPASEVIGRHFSIFYPQEALASKHAEHELEVAKREGVYEEEGLRVRRDGSTFWANVVITALHDKDGVLQGFAKVTRDVTEKRKTDEARRKFSEELERKVKERTEELEQSRRELIEQRDQLKRSNTDLQQFAYVASHDLQEPLRGIITCHQLLEKRFAQHITPEMQEYMSIAIESSQRMKALIEGLLQYGRAGELSLTGNPVDFNQIAQDALVMLKPAIDDAGAKVTFGDLPKLHADPALMTHVFKNLISNAIKYSGEKSPVVEVSAEKQGTAWIFTVKDNGMGIEPQYFERIFVIFQRLHSDRRKYPGTGIGLAVCKRIIEAHGGTISLESTPGVGTTFRFKVPT